MAVDATEPNPRPLPESRTSPWGRIAAGAGIAFDARKLILAALGLLIFWAGNAILREVFRGSTREWSHITGMIPRGPFEETVGLLPHQVGAPLTDTAEPALAMMRPFHALFFTGPNVFANGPNSGNGIFLHAILGSVWAAAVWGVFGGAICRVAAVQIATGGRIGIGTALRFALRKALSLIGSPLCPLIVVGLFAAFCGLFGLLYQVPGPVGATIAGALAFLPLLAGLVMALILAGLAAGWPLMIATVSTEGEDAFDALSRSYAYVFQRPARYAAFVLWAWLVGVIGLLVVSAFGRAVPHLAEWGLAFGAPDARLNDLFRGFSQEGAPVGLHRFWLGAVALIVRSWIYAYFWTAATQIYLLLRRDVDGTPLSDVYLPEHDADTFAPDLGAVAATKPEPAGDFAGVPPGAQETPVVPEI